MTFHRKLLLGLPLATLFLFVAEAHADCTFNGRAYFPGDKVCELRNMQAVLSPNPQRLLWTCVCRGSECGWGLLDSSIPSQTRCEWGR